MRHSLLQGWPVCCEVVQWRHVNWLCRCCVWSVTGLSSQQAAHTLMVVQHTSTQLQLEMTSSHCCPGGQHMRARQHTSCITASKLSFRRSASTEPAGAPLQPDAQSLKHTTLGVTTR